MGELVSSDLFATLRNADKLRRRKDAAKADREEFPLRGAKRTGENVQFFDGKSFRAQHPEEVSRFDTIDVTISP